MQELIVVRRVVLVVVCVVLVELPTTERLLLRVPPAPVFEVEFPLVEVPIVVRRVVLPEFVPPWSVVPAGLPYVPEVAVERDAEEMEPPLIVVRPGDEAVRFEDNVVPWPENRKEEKPPMVEIALMGVSE